MKVRFDDQIFTMQRRGGAVYPPDSACQCGLALATTTRQDQLIRLDTCGYRRFRPQTDILGSVFHGRIQLGVIRLAGRGNARARPAAMHRDGAAGPVDRRPSRLAAQADKESARSEGRLFGATTTMNAN